MKYISADLFSGVGGLTAGMHDAGFKTKIAVELEPDAVKGYKLNFPETKIIQEDIRKIKVTEIQALLGDQPLHLLAGCPPCPGFSTIRKLNRKASVRDGNGNLHFFEMSEKEKKSIGLW